MQVFALPKAIDSRARAAVCRHEPAPEGVESLAFAHLGGDAAGSEGGDGHVSLFELVVQAAAVVHEKRLRARIGGLVGHWRQPGHARDQHHSPTLVLFLEVGQEVRGEAHDAGHVGREHALEAVPAKLGPVPEVRDAGVQDRAVQRLALRGGLAHAIDVLGLLEIGDDGQHLDAGRLELLFERVETVGAACHRDDIGAVIARELARHLSTQARRGARHEHPAPAEFHRLHGAGL